MTVKVEPRCHATLLAENSSKEPVRVFDQALRDKIIYCIVIVAVVAFTIGVVVGINLTHII